MNTFSRSIVAASTALAVSFGGVVASAEPVSEDYTTRVSSSDPSGSGALPNTEGAEDMIYGSVDNLGMRADQAWDASQAGWGLLWTALALIGVAGIYTAAQQAGLI